MQYNVEVITPAKAEQLLKGQAKNRTLKVAHVENLAREMAAGRWALNGEPIILSENGVLDGQHRLHAVIASGMNIRTLVVRGADAATFDTIDTGRMRSAGDVLAIEGEINANILAAAVRCVVMYEAANWETTHANEIATTNGEVRAALAKYPEIRESVAYAAAYRGQRLISWAVSSALHFIFARIDRPAADQFMADVLIGSNLADGDPALVLRNRLIFYGDSKKTRVGRKYTMALAIKAWNCRRSGKAAASKNDIRIRIAGDKPESYPRAI